MRALAVVCLAVPLFAAAPKECLDHRRHGRMDQATACFNSLLSSNDPYFKAEGFWGLDNTFQANEQFRLAHARNPKSPELKTRWGKLFAEREQPAEAVALYQEALEIAPDYAPALLGLASLDSDRFEKKASELAQRALDKDPKLFEAQELLAKLALEDSNPKKALEEADKALKISPEALDAMAIHASIDYLEDRDGGPWLAKIAKINPYYGEANGIVGHFYIINRRYTEGIHQYRKAVALNPKLWAIRADLGVNLMRLGREGEARIELEAAFNAGYKGATTVNSLRLMDSYSKYDTYETPTTTIRLNKKESALLKPYMQQELDRCISVYEKKYKLKLSGPVQLELFPDHEDFAVRTMGMPGLGALGVTFGTSVAMDSPSARPPGSFHWASTLWHELSHVYTLTITHHRIPRWFTEGLAVHEETAISPDWGDRLDPQAIKAIQDKKLLPIAELDRGFIHPDSPVQVVVSYFQAGRICDWIDERWGFDKLLDMIHAFEKPVPTVDVIQQNLGLTPEQFDKEFLAWLDKKAGHQVKGFEEWRKLMKAVSQSAALKQYDAVITDGVKARDLYPDHVDHGSAYELIADAYLGKGDKASAAKELGLYSAAGGRNPVTIKKLAGLQAELGQKADAAKSLHRLIYVYPQDEELHRKLGNLYVELKNRNGAVMEFEALVAMKPIDQAGSRYLLARAYQDVSRIEDAKDQVLQSLEAAPGYRPAQKLLLELNRTK